MIPTHLKIFVRDLATNIIYSGDGDMSQGLFEDYILHEDQQHPPLKRGHYPRNARQMEQCVRYLEFCMEHQPGCLEFIEALFPLTADSSRLTYLLAKHIGDADNLAPSPEMLERFLTSEAA